MTWKEKYLIVFVALVGLSFLFFVTSSRVISSESSKIAKMDKKVKAKQEQLNSAEVLNEELSGVRDAIINSITKSKEEKSFSADERNEMIRFLQNMADSLHIPVTSLTHQEKFSPGKVIEHQYTIAMSCTYLQAGQYVTALEKTNRIMRINSLDVTPIREEKENANIAAETRYRVNLELSVFKVKRDFGEEVSSSADSKSESNDSETTTTTSEQ